MYIADPDVQQESCCCCHQSQLTADIRFHFIVCSAGQGSSSSSFSPAFQPAAEAAAAQLACAVITAPKLLIQLPATARKQLTEPVMLSMVMTALHHLASHQHQIDDTATHHRDSEATVNSNGGNQRFSSGTTLVESTNGLVKIQLDSREAALIALGNLAGMLCGQRVSKPTQVLVCQVSSNSSNILIK